LAIARAVADKRSFVVWYGDIYYHLRGIINDDNEFREIEEKLRDDIVNGRIENVYRFWGPCDDSECDVVVVSPYVLDSGKLQIVEELTTLYSFKGYDGYGDEYDDLTNTLHNLIEMWNSDCTHMSDPAEAVYRLAKRYGLKIDEEPHLDEERSRSDRWYISDVYYAVEGLDKRIVKGLRYCNDCMDFSTDNRSIDECEHWRFEDEIEPP
jgi:hypothetical protein